MGAKNMAPSVLPSKKTINPDKAPKRIIRKAQREKMKREHLNELFLKLADTLEIREQNSGKAFILGETTRVVQLMLDQINHLKEENATLLSESQYVKNEKNELEDETCALETQIGELKSMINERAVLDLNVPPVESQEPELTPCLEEDARLFHQVHVLNPVFMIPEFGVVSENKKMSNVSKPHPRYPTSLDSWPSHVLENVRSQLGFDSKV